MSMIILHISSADFKFKLAIPNSLSTTIASSPLKSICTSRNPDLCQWVTSQASSSYHSNSSFHVSVQYCAAVPLPSYACTACSPYRGSHTLFATPHIQSCNVGVFLRYPPLDSVPCCTPHVSCAVPIWSLHPRGLSGPVPSSPHVPGRSLASLAGPPQLPAVSGAEVHLSEPFEGNHALSLGLSLVK